MLQIREVQDKVSRMMKARWFDPVRKVMMEMNKQVLQKDLEEEKEPRREDLEGEECNGSVGHIGCRHV